MIQQDLFTTDAYGAQMPPPTGQQLRDKAIAQVAANAPANWIEDAITAIRHVCLSRTLISSDDIWPLVIQPPEPRAMGAALFGR